MSAKSNKILDALRILDELKAGWPNDKKLKQAHTAVYRAWQSAKEGHRHHT